MSQIDLSHILIKPRNMKTRNTNIYITALLLIASTLSAFSQTISPQVYPAQGGSMGAGNFRLQFTIGQPLGITLTAGNNEYSLGLQQPEMNIVPANISGSPVCPGSNISIPFKAQGKYASANIFTAQLSDSSGSFTNPVNIGTDTAVTSGTIPVTFPDSTLAGSNYKIRLISSFPLFTGAPSASFSFRALPNYVTDTVQQSVVCPGSSTNIYVLSSQTGIKYSLIVDTIVIGTGYGNGDTLSLNTGAVDTNTVFYVLVTDTISGCSLQLGYLSVNVFHIAPPNTPGPQAVNSDTAYTFSFVNIKPGAGGNLLEWSLDSAFSTSTITSCFDTVINGKDTSYCTIGVIVPANSYTLIWLRSRDSISGCISKAVTTIAIVEHVYQRPPLMADSIIMVCSGYASNINIPNSNDSLRYSLMIDTAVISSSIGTGSTLTLSTGALTTTTYFTILTTDTANGDTATLGLGIIAQVLGPVDTNVLIEGDTFVYTGDSVHYKAVANNGISAIYSLTDTNATVNPLTGWVTNIRGDFTVQATVYGPSGCSSAAGYLSVHTTPVAPPSYPVPVTVYIDTPTAVTTVSFSSTITAGAGGSFIEWDTTPSFATSHVVASPATISVTLTGVQTLPIYLRTTSTSNHSNTLKSDLSTNLPTISAGLLDKSNWVLVPEASDEFDYAIEANASTLYAEKRTMPEPYNHEFFNKWGLVFTWGASTASYDAIGNYNAGPVSSSTVCLCDWGNCPVNPAGTCGSDPGSGHEVWFTNDNGMGVAHLSCQRLPNAPVPVNSLPLCTTITDPSDFVPPVNIYYSGGNISSLIDKPLVNSMWEMRCRFPHDVSGSGSTESYGMWGFSGSVAINMMDVSCTSTKVNGTVQDDAWGNFSQDGIEYGGCGINTFKQTHCGYDDGWHTITAVTTENEIIYFIDGKESWSLKVANAATSGVDGSVGNGYWPTQYSSSATVAAINETMNIGIAANLPWHSTVVPTWEYAELQVDYFRYYKPSGPAPIFQNSSSGTPLTLETLYDNTIPLYGSPISSAITSSTVLNTPVSNNNILTIQNNSNNHKTRAIAPNTNMAYQNGLQKIYYAGSDGECYNAYYDGSNWYDYPLVDYVTDVASAVYNFPGPSLTFSGDRVYYCSTSNEIKFFQWIPNLEQWINRGTDIYCMGSLNVDEFSRLTYIGATDGDIYALTPSPSNPFGFVISQITYDGEAYEGLITHSCGCLVFYEGQTGNLHQQSWWGDWRDQGIIQHYASPTIAMDEHNSRLFYASNGDGVMHCYTWNYNQPNTAGGETLNSSSCVGVNMSYVNIGYENNLAGGRSGSIALSNDGNIVYYWGIDGNIWYFYNDKDHNMPANWNNAPLNLSAESAGPMLVESFNNGRLFYAGGDNVLHMIDWANADNVISCPNTQAPYGNNLNAGLRMDIIPDADSNFLKTADSLVINVYPNPSAGTFTFIISAIQAQVNNIVISNMTGQRVATLIGYSQTMVWDASIVNPGIYYYKAKLSNGNFASGKLVKID